MTDALQTIVETLEKNLSTKQVFGETLEIGGVTMVPVMDLTFGFGGGTGEGRGKENEGGTGGGGGGAARMAPRAVLVIRDGTVTIMPIAKGGSLEKLADAIPGLIEKFAAKKPEAKAEAEAEAE